MGTNSQFTSYIGVWFAIQGVLLAITTLFDKVGNYGRKSSVAANISKSCGYVASELSELLANIDRRSLDETWAIEQLNQLIKQKSEITNAGQAAGINVSNRSKESERAANSAYDYLENRYA